MLGAVTVVTMVVCIELRLHEVIFLELDKLPEDQVGIQQQLKIYLLCGFGASLLATGRHFSKSCGNLKEFLSIS